MNAPPCRYEIWGRYLDQREMMIERLQPWDKHDEVLAEYINSYSSKWTLWCEHRPLHHPHVDVPRPAAPAKGRRMKLKLEKHEGRPEGWSDPVIQSAHAQPA